MKRPFDPIPEKQAEESVSAEGAKATKRVFPKRKVAMILGYSGTGYQGMQRYMIYFCNFINFYI